MGLLLFGNSPLVGFSILGRLGGLHLQLELVGDQGDELTVGGLALGVADGVAEKSLECIQVASVPGHLNGMADGPLHPGGCGLEGLGHLRIQDLGDGVDGVPTAHLTATAATVFVDDL